MNKLKGIKFILIIISIFFFINIDVNALDFTCEYKSGSNVLRLSMSGEYGVSVTEFPLSYSLSINKDDAKERLNSYGQCPKA